MTGQVIKDIDNTYSFIVFAGFKYQTEHLYDDWVYWLPRYILANTSLRIFF